MIHILKCIEIFKVKFLGFLGFFGANPATHLQLKNTPYWPARSVDFKFSEIGPFTPFLLLDLHINSAYSPFKTD